MKEGLKKVMPVANARPVKNKNNVMITIVIFITPCRAMAWQIANESKQLCTTEVYSQMANSSFGRRSNGSIQV